MFADHLDVHALGLSKLKNLISSFPSMQLEQSQSGETYVMRAQVARNAVTILSREEVVDTETQKAPSKKKCSIYFIDSTPKLDKQREKFPFSCLKDFRGESLVAVGHKGSPQDVFLIQVATMEETFVFDCIGLGAPRVCEFLKEMLMNGRVAKLFHDLHSFAVVWSLHGKTDPLRGTFDTQLAIELKTGEPFVDFKSMLTNLEEKDKTRVMKKLIQNERGSL